MPMYNEMSLSTVESQQNKTQNSATTGVRKSQQHTHTDMRRKRVRERDEESFVTYGRQEKEETEVDNIE